MHLRKIFNRLGAFIGFVYGRTKWSPFKERVVGVHIRARRESQAEYEKSVRLQVD
jgi:hypothetical protein